MNRVESPLIFKHHATKQSTDPSDGSSGSGMWNKMDIKVPLHAYNLSSPQARHLPHRIPVFKGCNLLFSVLPESVGRGVVAKRDIRN